MTGQLVMPPVMAMKKFWPKVADGFAEYGLQGQEVVVESNVAGEVVISWPGGFPPVRVAWGDGEEDVQESSPAHHSYHVDGDYTITVVDTIGQTSTAPVTIADAVP